MTLLDCAVGAKPDTNTASTGNKPPWTLPAKAAYGDYDFERAKRAVGLPDITLPGDLMVLGRTQVPLRALHAIKARFPAETYLAAFHYLLYAFWVLHSDMTSAEGVGKVLAEIPVGFAGKGTGDASRPLFTAEQIGEVLRAVGSQPCKDALKKSTDEALRRGAFGCPWLWVTDREGKGEPFFGSDRLVLSFSLLDWRVGACRETTAFANLESTGGITFTSFWVYLIRMWLYCHLPGLGRASRSSRHTVIIEYVAEQMSVVYGASCHCMSKFGDPSPAYSNRVWLWV